jgi:hypothetical protein
MVIEPFVRMGPLPRSLAAEANNCFMVRLSHAEPTEYKCAARSFAPYGRLPSVRLQSPTQYSNKASTGREDERIARRTASSLLSQRDHPDELLHRDPQCVDRVS